ncbi:zinc/iron regulated transporter-related protein 102B isoform X2 [Osmia lignaria lignaria]|uniref:zinc transporter ZIP9-A isoform X2 n=1 Tax=Osmia bicornis bicornis TaxID=1437191 RepID=UPI0010FA439D|nr:zinc transporter ZIP9-A isoform X2 [Osmia bicornis bicornis]XP_029040254.1 zinc transporter ZIP9-A isoform X2 [Osmia bicornis bicornis]XP_034187187.1 zinc transporter ZIP9-A isoform X1 [Osmia lignaria]XP_034187188.1 zinc transporter ZIP9-A isoform X1 [Osmia lignaria]
MEESSVLWMLSLVMLIGSCIAGSLPLVMNLSEDKLQLVSILGAGLLVGTALAVIIPEGIRALFTGGSNSDQGFHNDPHSLIGISLILGFVFMLLVDQCSARRSGGREKSVTATLGLVVHAAADGVALGAAATTSQADVELIVFLAIMLHKAPAAFGLVSFLLHEGVDRKKIGRHLLVFSFAAPCLALLTYFGIGKEGKETLSNVNATGLAMLFSAGTFLYVSTVHVLPELMTRNNNTYAHLPSAENVAVSSGLKVKEILVLVMGSFLPALITTGHHH